MPGWLKWVLMGCGSVVLIVVIGMVGCVVWWGSGPESGVNRGGALRIEVAPLNDGTAFFRALERARAAVKPGAPVDADAEAIDPL